MSNPQLDKYVANRRKGGIVNKLKFEDLSIDEVNVVFMALAKMPYEQVAQLFHKLQQQAQAQVPQQQPPNLQAVK